MRINKQTSTTMRHAYKSTSADYWIGLSNCGAQEIKKLKLYIGICMHIEVEYKGSEYHPYEVRQYDVDF